MTSSGSSNPWLCRALLACVAIAILGLGWWWWGRDSIPASDRFQSAIPARTTQVQQPTHPAPTAVAEKSTPVAAPRLHGLVVSAKNEPVPGATVRMVGPVSATVESNYLGEFRFEPSPEGAYFLDAEAGSAAATPVLVHFTAQTGLVVLHLSSAAGLSVSVVSATDQSPISNAAVEIRAAPTYGEALLKSGLTNEKGEYLVRGLAPGGYTAAAQAKGFRPLSKLLSPQAGLTWEITLALAPGSEVRGTIVDEAGRGVARAVVRPYPADRFFESRIGRQVTTFDTVSDKSGLFILPALEPGTFRLNVTHSDFLPGWSDVFTMEGTPKSGLTIKLEKGASVEGRVVKFDGSPVARAVVRVNAVAQEVRGAGVRELIADDSGTFHLSGLPRARMHVVASDGSSSSENVAIDLDSGDVRNLEIRLQLDGTITGVVTNRFGAAIENAQVVCVGMPRGAVGTRPVLPETTDAHGRFTCSALAPGQFFLTATRPYPNNNQSPARRSAGISAMVGARDVRIVLPDDGTIVGRVSLSGQTLNQFSIALDNSAEPRMFNSADGSFTLDGLAPGSYSLQIAGPSFSRKLEVTVPEGDTLDLGMIDVRSQSGESQGAPAGTGANR